MLSHSTVKSAGVPERTASSLSTVIVCVAEELFPQSSVAVNVLVIIVKQPSTTDDSSKSIVGSASQLSLTNGIATAGTKSQLTVTSAGTPARAGATSSDTSIICEAETEFPHASVAVHVRVKVKLYSHAPGVVVSSKETFG